MTLNNGLLLIGVLLVCWLLLCRWQKRQVYVPRLTAIRRLLEKER